MREQKQNTTDRGWEAMQRILDREMPRRRRRRVAVWWWLTGLLLLPLLGIAGWKMYQHSIETTPVTPAPTLPAVPLAERTPSTALPNTAALNSQTAASSEETAFIDYRKQSSHRNRVATTAPLSSRPSDATTSLAKKGDDLAMESSTVLSLENSKIERQAVSAEVDFAPMMALSLLPAVAPAIEQEPEPLVFPTYPAYSSAELIKKAPHRATWDLGITAGINSERLPRINGGAIGIVADWQPLRRWGLRSGVQYAVQRLAPDESLVTTISEDAYEKSSSELSLFDQSGNYGNITQFSSINTNILASVRRIHRIEAPLLVYWQPVRKLRTYVGASVNYTFLAQISPRIFSENQVFKVVSGRDELNKLATEKLNRWQVKWQVGLGYRINRHLEVTGGVQAALPKISLQKDAGNDSALGAARPAQNIATEEIRQLGFMLRGVVLF